jgi:hypothetical protein
MGPVQWRENAMRVCRTDQCAQNPPACASMGEDQLGEQGLVPASHTWQLEHYRKEAANFPGVTGAKFVVPSLRN